MLYIIAILSCFISFSISNYCLPVFIKFAKKFNFLDRPTSRKKHVHEVPYFGGICMYSSISLTVLLMSVMFSFAFMDFVNFKKVFGLFLSLFILMILGIRDDIFSINPFYKLIFQVLVSIFLIIFCDIRVLSLNGLFDIYSLSYTTSFMLSLFMFISLINAFNLIDGIDGLAASIAAIFVFFMGVVFVQINHHFYDILMFSVFGALLSFLLFNLSKSKQKKIFLGDNGSMSLGLICAFISILLMNLNSSYNNEFPDFFKNFNIVIMALLAYPLLDMIRVFFLRLLNGDSPFKADNNHLHHHLIKLLSHKKSTLIISLYTILLCFTSFKLRFLDVNYHFLLMAFLSLKIYLIPLFIKKYKY